MKLKVRNDDTAAQAIADRWKLDLQSCIAKTPRANVFKVDGPYGISALKLYKEVGAAGEGAAVPFLRNLPPDVGVKIHRVSPLRTAILMDWIEGPSLDQLVAQGEDTRAAQHLADVAQTVANTSFKLRFIYQRVAPRLKHDIAKRANQPTSDQSRANLQRSITLLDQLIKTTTQEKVIHGDLGFHNVILTANGPRLIDPKGLRADPAFEFALGLIRPFHDLPLADFRQRTQSRATLFADAMGASPTRLIQWAAILLAQIAYKARKRPQTHDVQPYLTALLDMSEA